MKEKNTYTDQRINIRHEESSTMGDFVINETSVTMGSIDNETISFIMENNQKNNDFVGIVNIYANINICRDISKTGRISQQTEDEWDIIRCRSNATIFI